MTPEGRVQKTNGKKRMYLIIEIASILVFTIPILIFINNATVDWAEENKNSFTNGDLLSYVGMMLVGSVLIAALIGLLICMVVRLIIGKEGKKVDNIKIVAEKEPKIKKRRETPDKTEVLFMLVAILGFGMALTSFLFCTGIEYVSFDQDIMRNEVYLEGFTSSVVDTVSSAFVSEVGLSEKWGVLIEVMQAIENEESISFWSLFAPDKIVILGLLAIVISVTQLKFGCGKEKLNIATIIIAVISMLLNYFLAPWIQLFGGVFYHTVVNGFVLWVTGMYDLLKQTAEALMDLFLPFLSEEFRNQKYIDG